MTNAYSRGDALAKFIVGSTSRSLPSLVVHEARRSLVDYLGVSLAGIHERSARAVLATVNRWQSAGRAPIFLGPRTAPALAALVNGTRAHALDYDDIHYWGAGHPGGPCWSSALAVAAHHGKTDEAALRAFVAGFEVMARLGGGGTAGVGRSLQRRGFHPTSLLGRAGAATAAAALLDLNEEGARNALGAAATTFGGLLGSFGTDGKPFHAGKAAMDGVLAAELAADGFEAAHHLYERQSGWLDAFLPAGEVEVPSFDFGQSWQILRNGYKVCASCGATHSPGQLAHQLHQKIGPRPIKRVRATVHASVLVTAANPRPTRALEGKFSTQYCIALGLRGYRLLPDDFSEMRLADSAVTELLPRIELIADDRSEQQSATLEVWLQDGERLEASMQVARGNPENPLSDDDLNEKFEALSVPVLGRERARALHTIAMAFGEPGSLAELNDILAAPIIEHVQVSAAT